MKRSSFLKTVAISGLGALFGGSPLWKEKGVTLTVTKRQSLVMGSVISFTVIAGKKEDAFEAINRAEQVFRSVDKIFSMYDEESEMGRLAKYAGRKPIPLSNEALQLLKYVKTVYRESNKFFDITIEPVMRRWGFRKDPKSSIELPSDKELQKLEQLIGTERILLEKEGVMLEKPGMMLDTGGIAGGFALDKAVEEMKKANVAAGFINFSGDIHCFGHPREGEKWPVFLLDPRTLQPLSEPILLFEEALSTSGSYQNRRHNERGRSWGHLLFPGKLKPVKSSGSVTAIHRSAMTADAWSTAAYVGAKPPKEVRTVTL